MNNDERLNALVTIDNHITKLAWLLSAAVLFSADVTIAQTNAETNAGVQFNFSTPGAKSMALGGAFVGLADDATAAYANPAGLTILSRPEVSMEFRNSNYTHEFTDRGRLEGTPTGLGVDQIVGLQNGEAEENVTGLSFLSYVYPKKSWAIAFYRHELANFEANFETQGAFITGSSRLLPSRTSMRLDIVNIGISIGFKLGKRTSAGIGLARYDFSINSNTTRFILSDRYGPAVFSNSRARSSQAQAGNSFDLGLIAGFLWKISDNFSIGSTYRQGPDFNFHAIFKPLTQAPGSFAESDQLASFQIPNVYGLGAAFQPTDNMTISFDCIWIENSRLTGRLTNIFGPNLDNINLRRFKADDAAELRLGFEYFFLKPRIPVAIRLGSWTDPDHRIRFEGQDLTFRTLFQPGDDDIHYSVGFGIVASTFQVDIAFDDSRLTKTASVSAVIRF